MDDLEEVVSYDTKTYFVRGYDFLDGDDEWYIELELEIESTGAPKEEVLKLARLLLAKVEEDYSVD